MFIGRNYGIMFSMVSLFHFFFSAIFAILMPDPHSAHIVCTQCCWSTRSTLRQSVSQDQGRGHLMCSGIGVERYRHRPLPMSRLGDPPFEFPDTSAMPPASARVASWAVVIRLVLGSASSSLGRRWPCIAACTSSGVGSKLNT